MRTLRAWGKNLTRRGNARAKGVKRTSPIEKRPSARATMKKEEEERMMAILTSNFAASSEFDVATLDSPTLAGSPETIRNDIETLTDNDRVVAPMKVTVAAVFGKLAFPSWDTRKHQVGIGGLKSLRTLDHAFVANHLYRMGLYRTATEGILTRSFELKQPFTLDYPGEINPVKSKLAFLRIINRINEEGDTHTAETVLRYFLHRLKEKKGRVDAIVGDLILTDKYVSLKTGQDILNDIFGLGAGISATPAIVIHTAFSIVQPYIWKDVQVSPLKRHTASDSTSKAIGDVEAYRNDAPFLSVEVKHKLQIDDTMIRTFLQKTGNIPLRFMLTTRAVHTKYTEENVLIGNVTDLVMQYLHSVTVHNPAIGSAFVTSLRAALVGSPDIGADNKAKIAEIFTKHLVSPSPE
jgi:hypothetical protein